jgi:hypothetical protein
MGSKTGAVRLIKTANIYLKFKVKYVNVLKNLIKERKYVNVIDKRQLIVVVVLMFI